MSEAECFKPSTFASREAKAAEQSRLQADNDAVLVSLGRTEHWMKDRRGKDEYRPGELFMERGKPMHLYVSLDGDPHMYPLFNQTAARTDAEPLGTFSRDIRFPGAFPEPSAPTAVRPV